MSPKASPERDEIASIQHWSVYGQKGEPSARRIEPEEWEVKSFKRPASTKWKGSVPADQVLQLLNGFCPTVMEEKWFVYSDGPDAAGNAAIHMHRSWCGEKMVELRIKVPLEDGELANADARIKEIVWESDPTRWRWASEEFAKATAIEVCDWVMDVKLGISK
ncbi:hypothetical protein CONLIGDRAFT_645486 [Coniochaeta ligniaria NRRL 30616]|uniref:Uncharacterized protein n=1 Tax=Coniochaeta ligniaria NRRL 30616 TaxID=1408157 RepID=A0A1J7JBQ0_9PEZI|nr:hypothetical protein CONLIGDRAFT_645486 [Coniochaeta ligniaria NRRL 30616]